MMKQARDMMAGLVLGLALTTQVGAADYEPYFEQIDRVVTRIDEVVAKGPYKADFSDLGKHEALPEWFRDAKYGIYWHWGVYSVPAHGSEWYPRNMHMGLKQYHESTFGPLPDYPYHTFIPRFGAERFDADAWAELFVKSGARYAGPVAEHHDGFSMWESRVTPWNVGNMGPKRDLTGELEKAIRSRGMRFVTSFHHAFNGNGYYSDKNAAWATASKDPYLQLLYGKLPKDRFHGLWQAKLAEVIDTYKPDLIWFDSWLDRIPQSVRARFGAYYLNRAHEWGKDVVITRKQGDLPLSWSVEDFEKGRAAEIRPDGFLTDDTLSTGSWCYTDRLGIKSTDTVVDAFIDLVSKNGCLLLNISPKADGTIPQNQQAVLLDLGAWLKVNGEAIFSTRPWHVFGEGPTRLQKGGHFVRMKGGYKAADIRFTQSKDGQTLYAIALGAPAGKVELKSVNFDNDEGSVELLGHGKLRFTVLNKKMTIETPAKMPTDWAHAFKLSGFTCSLDSNASALAAMPGNQKVKLSEDTVLDATEAGLSGDRIQVEGPDANPNIGWWDNAGDKAYWQVRIPRPGTYAVTATVSAPVATKLVVQVEGGKSAIGDIPVTGGFQSPRKVALGEISFSKAGVNKVTIRPVDRKSWKAINVWKLELKRTAGQEAGSPQP
jgi:alpha-L-fucosidase